MGKRKNSTYPLRKTLVHVGKYPTNDLDRINETRQEFIQNMNNFLENRFILDTYIEY